MRSLATKSRRQPSNRVTCVPGLFPISISCYNLYETIEQMKIISLYISISKVLQATTKTHYSLKWPAHGKNFNLYFFSRSKKLNATNISVLYKTTGPTGSVHKQIAPKQCSASYDTKIFCIQFLWAGAKKYKLSFFLKRRPFKERLTDQGNTFYFYN